MVLDVSEGKWLITEVNYENFRESGEKLCCQLFFLIKMVNLIVEMKRNRRQKE